MNSSARRFLPRCIVVFVAFTAAGLFLTVPFIGAEVGDKKAAPKKAEVSAAPADDDAKPKSEPAPGEKEKAAEKTGKAPEKSKDASAERRKERATPAAEDKTAKPRAAAKKSVNLETRVFEVALNFFKVSTKGVASDPFAEPEVAIDPGAVSPSKALETIGITFGPGASAVYNPATLQLTVRNTAEQLDLISIYVSSVNSQREKQVHIIWEMIEVEHAEFSDWLFDNRLNSDGSALRNWAQEKINKGDAAIIETTMVTARSGQRAKVESIHEMIYPTEFNPSEIPDEVELSGKAKAPVTAAGPAAYETRNVGTTLEVDPVIGSDNTTIDLNLAPEKIQLAGYSVWPNEEVDPLFKQRMPIFYSMRITTQITLSDGNYGFLGTLRPLEASVEGIKDPIVLSFVRADVGVVPLARPRGAK